MEQAQLNELSRRVAYLSGQKESLRSRASRLKESVSISKAWIENEDDVKGVIKSLQISVKERALASFEALLTALLRDVLPGQHRVVLDIKTTQSQSMLYIKVTDETGENLEDVNEGRGGSVTNILATGFRFIIMNRAGLFPFLVLDEADCWLSPERVPQFVSTIHQVAVQQGIQVLMVSHHDPSAFGPEIHRVKMFRTGDSVSTRTEPGQQAEWKDGQRGIRGIHLQNFMSHVDTHISLNPGLTLLLGDNDIGKSAVVAALRSIYYSSRGGNDRIRHGCKEASVIIDHGDDGWLTWSKIDKKSNNTTYTLTGKDGQVLHETIGVECPDWLQAMGFVAPEGIEIQFASQKEPALPLNAKAGDLAKLISVGREGQYVEVMHQLFNLDSREHKRIVREGEKELTQIDETFDVLSPIAAIGIQLESMQDEVDVIVHSKDVIDKLGVNVSSISAFHGINEIVSLPKFGEAPELEDVAVITKAINLIGSVRPVINIPMIGDVCQVPNIDDVTELKKISSGINSLMGCKQIQIPQEIVQPKNIEDTASLEEYIYNMNLCHIQRGKAKGDLQQLDQDFSGVEVRIDTVIDEMGGLCPVCNNVLNKEHLFLH